MAIDLPISARKTGVYCIRNLFDGKEYVGSAARGFKRRWDAHIRQLRAGRHPNWLLQAAWNACGEAAFSFEVLEECPPEQCITQEQERIDAMDPEYNICREAGSTLGRKCTLAVRAEMSARRKGLPHSKEWRANISAALKGRTITPEWRNKLSIAQTGRRHSPATREKMSCSHTFISPESRARISASQKRRWKNYRLASQPQPA